MTLADLLRRAAGEDKATGYPTAELVRQAYALGFTDADSGNREQLAEDDPAWSICDR
jgi:hypothetical protein